MRILEFFIGLARLLNGFMTWLNSRSLKQAGRDQVVRDSLEEQQKRVEKARHARRVITEHADSLRQDKYQRD